MLSVILNASRFASFAEQPLTTWVFTRLATCFRSNRRTGLYTNYGMMTFDTVSRGRNAMITKYASFAEARGKVRAALAAMGSGRPEAYIDCWARSDDTTLFGAWGPIQKGYQHLVEIFRWVGRRPALGGAGWGNLMSAELGAMGTVRLGWSGGSRHSSPPVRPMRCRMRPFQKPRRMRSDERFKVPKQAVAPPGSRDDAA
jgi:hypothetical protein